MSAPTVNEPTGTSRLHTSEPRWPTEPPEIDPAARTILVVAGNDPGAAEAREQWAAAAAGLGIAVETIDLDEAAIETALAQAAAASRLMVAGDECALALATSAAERAGWSRAEVRAVLTDPAGPRPVQCVHCKAITRTTAEIDEVADCEACGVPLLLFPHYSRRHGAYLGFRVDSEELPA